MCVCLSLCATTAIISKTLQISSPSFLPLVMCPSDECQRNKLVIHSYIVEYSDSCVLYICTCTCIYVYMCVLSRLLYSSDVVGNKKIYFQDKKNKTNVHVIYFQDKKIN